MARTTKETSIPQPELGEYGHQRECAARAEAGDKPTGIPGAKHRRGQKAGSNISPSKYLVSYKSRPG
jgi:hypothetical protein